MLERTDAITNEVLETITFVLAYRTVLCFTSLHDISQCFLREQKDETAFMFVGLLLDRMGCAGEQTGGFLQLWY